MNCQSARDTFPALLDRRTTATEHAEARAHLAGCPDCQREFAALSQTLAALDALPAPAPSPRLRKNFHALLEAEKNSAASVRPAAPRTHRASLWRWILSPALGAALLLAGFFAGTRYSAAPASGPAGDDATKRELAQIKSQMAKMTQLVGYQLLQQQQGPTNERLQEVLAAARSDQPSDGTLDDLIKALAFDPSANVRLRALEALYAHADREFVRSGVLASLPREQNPLVQLELIDFVAAAHDREATPVLEKISRNETIDQSVRDAARRALAQL
ncbi:MAG TPA: zf-HC2 domain-containing protein [Opitutaceae bacterium]|nr:zf-HC2 domain-containing protein [Opitutaceae bacterium]